MNRPGMEPNLAGTMLRRAELSPARIALIFEDQEITYAEFGDRVRRLSSVLKSGLMILRDACVLPVAGRRGNLFWWLKGIKSALAFCLPGKRRD